MRRLLFPTLIFLCIFAFSVSAQNPQITDLSAKIQQGINSLATDSAKDFFNRSSNSRDQTNNFLFLQQSKITIDIFAILIKNNRPNSELRDVAETLDERFNRYDSDTSNRSQSQQIKKDIDNLIDELKKSNNIPEKKPEKNNGLVGTVHWQGTVDDEVQLIIHDSIVQTKTISGKDYNDGIFNFTSPLPNENVQVSVNKKEGRGTVKVIQQPTVNNDFTAIIQILDKNGGAREYDLEISWKK